MKNKFLLHSEPLESRLQLAGDTSNPIVTLSTNAGDISIELFADEAPQTVQNFIDYVNDGDYVDSIFHRLVPGFVIQGGGFSSTSNVVCDSPCTPSTDVVPSQFARIETNDPVQNEPGISNTRGTIAMAKLGGDPNSATNQFFVNLGDNSANLDLQNGGFTVFGCIVDMTSVDQMAQFATENLQSANSAFSDVPVFDEGGSTQVIRVQQVSSEFTTLSGSLFQDLDGDGASENGEGGLDSVTVFLDANKNGILDTGERSMQTASDGSYSFAVRSGTYTVRPVELPDNFTLTTGETAELITAGGSGQETIPAFGFQYTGGAWTNSANATDVDTVGGVTPVDALLVINELTNREISAPGTGLLPNGGAPFSNQQYLDVDGDNFVSPTDALLVINALPNSSSRGSARLVAPLASNSSAKFDVDQQHDDDTSTTALDEFYASLQL